MVIPLVHPASCVLSLFAEKDMDFTVCGSWKLWCDVPVWVMDGAGPWLQQTAEDSASCLQRAPFHFHFLVDLRWDEDRAVGLARARLQDPFLHASVSFKSLSPDFEARTGAMAV